MEEIPNHQHRPASRLAIRGGIGEIVEVQGGHIVRSTGRKDRHSKVCTAKGPRDRRVRLSAHTAIQFYDVQDRLGYDRPSKAVDWLIKNAKSAIDELAKLPAWNPNNNNLNQNSQEDRENREENNQNEIGVAQCSTAADAAVSVSNGGRILGELGGSENPNSGGPGFIPPLGSEVIAESIKSFFPMETNSSTPSIHYQNYSPSDSGSRRNATTSGRSSASQNNQDLRLSLQSFPDPIMLHQAQNQAHHNQNEELFPATTSLGFHGASFPENEQRMIAWNNSGGGGGGNCHVSGGGFVFNSSPSMTTMPTLPPIFLGQSQYFSSQRGPLQSSNNNNSSNNPLIRAWIDSSMSDHHFLPQTFHHNQSNYVAAAAGGGIGFDSGGGGFSGFRIPARIQGEEGHDGVSDKPSSASSDSRH